MICTTPQKAAATPWASMYPNETCAVWASVRPELIRALFPIAATAITNEPPEADVFLINHVCGGMGLPSMHTLLSAPARLATKYVALRPRHEHMKTHVQNSSTAAPQAAGERNTDNAPTFDVANTFGSKPWRRALCTWNPVRVRN